MEGRAKKKKKVRERGDGEGLQTGIFVYGGWSIRLQLEINQNPKGAVLKLQDCVVLS